MDCQNPLFVSSGEGAGVGSSGLLKVSTFFGVPLLYSDVCLDLYRINFPLEYPAIEYSIVSLIRGFPWSI